MKNLRPLRNTGTLIVTYTILFSVMMAGIFALFIIQGRSFVNHADAYDQGYFWTVEVRHGLESLLSGNGFPLWSWYRGTGFELKLNVDPFIYLAALFPAGYVELGYTIAIICRLYFAGIAFILFCKEVELDNFKALTGALCYVSSTWALNLSLVQGQYTIMFLLFPFLVMSVDRIYKGKSPAFFMIMVGITVAVNYYLAFMAAIGIIMYIVLRYFRYYDFNAKQYFSYLGRFIIYGVVGILCAAGVTLVTLQSVSGATTSTSTSVPYLYGIGHYLNTGLYLLSGGYRFSYTYIGIPIFALLIVFAFRGRPTIKATHAIMAFLMFLMSLSPFFASMFNAFMYASNRWYYMLIFFIVWCAAEHMDLDELSKTRNIIIMFVWWVILGVTTLGFAYFDVTGNLSLGSAMFIGGNLAAGMVMIILILLGRKVITSLRARQTLIVAAVIGTLVISWNCSFYGKTGYYFHNGEINDQLEKSTQRVGAMIDDDSFYRIDMMDWINVHLHADQPVNENMWWQNNTMYLYDSKIPQRLLEFNKLVGNNMGYSKRVYVQSNGNRMGLDFLYGVKYFLGDDEKNGRTGADAYAGYGFEPYEQLDGVNVFRSKYSSGLGFMYDKYMPESEFLKLSRLEREQALLQALVVPDEDLGDMDQSMEIKAEDIETDIECIPYEIAGTENVKVLKDGSFRVKKDGGLVAIRVKDVRDSQLVVSFDGLQRFNKKGKAKSNFVLKCTNERLTAEANNKKNNQTIKGIVDYDLNMGYYYGYEGILTLQFSKSGTYTFDRMYVSGMKTANFDKFAKKRSVSTYEVSEVRSSRVTGTVDAKMDGYLFISMPVYGNWDIYIDGIPAREIHNANIAFLATPVTRGQHDVELRYDNTNRLIALGITCAGLVLVVLISLLEKRLKKRAAGLQEEHIPRHAAQ